MQLCSLALLELDLGPFCISTKTIVGDGGICAESNYIIFCFRCAQVLTTAILQTFIIIQAHKALNIWPLKNTAGRMKKGIFQSAFISHWRDVLFKL